MTGTGTGSEGAAGSTPSSAPNWRDGFDMAATGMDCRRCGARVGVRPELARRHRQWHRELDDLLAARASADALDDDQPESQRAGVAVFDEP